MTRRTEKSSEQAALPLILSVEYVPTIVLLYSFHTQNCNTSYEYIARTRKYKYSVVSYLVPSDREAILKLQFVRMHGITSARGYVIGWKSWFWRPRGFLWQENNYTCLEVFQNVSVAALMFDFTDCSFFFLPVLLFTKFYTINSQQSTQLRNNHPETLLSFQLCTFCIFYRSLKEFFSLKRMQWLIVCTEN